MAGDRGVEYREHTPVTGVLRDLTIDSTRRRSGASGGYARLEEAMDSGEVFAACAEERRLERERLLPLFVQVYNAGYEAGHHDTVEGGFVVVYQADKATYHSDIVAELIAELPDA